MEIDELMQFLGLPAQNEEFDNYLSLRGIVKRPVFTESPIERINWKEGGLSLVFDEEDGYRSSWGEPRESGEMIFASLQAYGPLNDSGFSPFKGRLPFNFTFNTTLAQAKTVLGEPTLSHPSGPNHVYRWYGHKGNTIGLCFLPDEKGLSFFGIEKSKKNPPVPVDW